MTWRRVAGLDEVDYGEQGNVTDKARVGVDGIGDNADTR